MVHNLIVTGEALVFIYSAFLFGELVIRLFRIQEESKLLRLTYALMLGYGAWGFTGLILSLLCLFSTPYLWLVALGLFVISLKDVISHFHLFLASLRAGKWFSQFFKEHGWFKFIIAIWLIADFIIVFVPITGHDTLDYHLPIMKALVSEEKLVFSASDETQIPVFGEIIYSVPMQMFKETSPPFVFQLIQFSSLPLFLCLFFGFIRRNVSRQFLSFVGVLLILSIMDFLREVLHGGYVDVFAFIYGLGSALLLIQSATDRTLDRSRLLLSALFLGVALSIKYTGFIFGAIDFLVLLVAFFRSRAGFSQNLRQIIIYGLVTVFIAGFWYLKNFLIFGNPIYPMFSVPEFDHAVQWFIMDRTVLNFFYFPFFRFSQWFIQDVETSSRLIVLAYFIFSYLLFTLLAITKKIRLVEFLLFAFVELYLAFLFISSHQYRFLLPAEIMLTPLLVIMFDNFLDYLKAKLGE